MEGKSPGSGCGSEGRAGPAESNAGADQDGMMGWLFGDLDKCSEDTSQPEWTKEMLGVGGTQMLISGYFVAGLEAMHRDRSADTGRSSEGYREGLKDRRWPSVSGLEVGGSEGLWER